MKEYKDIVESAEINAIKIITVVSPDNIINSINIEKLTNYNKKHMNDVGYTFDLDILLCEIIQCCEADYDSGRGGLLTLTQRAKNYIKEGV